LGWGHLRPPITVLLYAAATSMATALKDRVMIAESASSKRETKEDWGPLI